MGLQNAVSRSRSPFLTKISTYLHDAWLLLTCHRPTLTSSSNAGISSEPTRQTPQLILLVRKGLQGMIRCFLLTEVDYLMHDAGCDARTSVVERSVSFPTLAYSIARLLSVFNGI
jgi:hypothetical protein